MDNQPPSIQKPLHGYKKLIRGQLCRLRNKSQQPTGSSSPESKKPESLDENGPLEETVIKVSCQQWQEEGSVPPTHPSIDVRWKGKTCQNKATSDTADQDDERDNRSRENCQAQLTETSSIDEISIEEKQERYIRDSLLLDDVDQGTRQNIAEKTSQSTGAIRGSRCEPYSNVSNVKCYRHFSQMKRDGQDGGIYPRAITTGGPLDLRTTQGPELKNDGSNISVVIDDPLTVDLLLAEQGQLFHTGEAIRTSNELLRDAINSRDKSRKNVSIVSRTQQVEVAVRNRTITEASITTFSEKVTESRFVYSSVSTETRLAPRSTSTLMEEGRNLRQILDKGKISREKHVRFADEADNLKLCSTSSTCQETAMPSGVEHPHAYTIDITPRCVGTLSKDSKTKGRENSDQKNNRHYRQESRIESVHGNAQESAIIHGNRQDVSNDAVCGDSKPDPDLGNKAFGFDGIEGKAQQENKMPKLPTPRSSAQALGSLSISNRATTFVSPAVTTKQSSLRKPAVPRMLQSAENARFPPRTDSVSPGKRKNESGIMATSSIKKGVTPFKTRGANSSSVRGVVPIVANRVLQSRSEPVTSRRSRREQAPVSPVATPVYMRHKCRNCLVALLRLGLIVLIFVLFVQALAFCLAVGFVTECDSNSVLFSPFWGFSWIKFDVTPLASIVRQNLRLVNYKTPPT